MANHCSSCRHFRDPPGERPRCAIGGLGAPQAWLSCTAWTPLGLAPGPAGSVWIFAYGRATCPNCHSQQSYVGGAGNTWTGYRCGDCGAQWT